MKSIDAYTSDPFIKAAEILLCADEPLMALKLLDMLPAYERANPPAEIVKLKNEIHARLATASFYATDQGYELTITDEACLTYKNSLRGALLMAEVERCNSLGLKPHITDMGAGEYWLPLILEGGDFTYKPIYVNAPTYNHCLKRFEKYLGEADPKRPHIFVACEVIEHLYYEEEIKNEALRVLKPDVIHVSTPLYAFNTQVKNWKDIGTLGHLRTYTAMEFNKVVTEMFPGYAGSYYKHLQQHIRLVNNETVFEPLKAVFEFKNEG